MVGQQRYGSLLYDYEFLIEKELAGGWKHRPDITWGGLSRVRCSLPSLISFMNFGMKRLCMSDAMQDRARAWHCIRMHVMRVETQSSDFTNLSRLSV